MKRIVSLISFVTFVAAMLSWISFSQAEETHSAALHESDNSITGAYIDNVIDPRIFGIDVDVQEIADAPQRVIARTTSKTSPVVTEDEPRVLDGAYLVKVLKRKNTGDDYYNSYYIEMEDGELLRIDTARDLDDVIGKKIVVWLEGFDNDFVLLNVDKSGKLPEPEVVLVASGPADILLAMVLMALAGAGYIRYRKYA